MALLVGTGVWSLAYLRDNPRDLPEVESRRQALTDGDVFVTIGMILLQLLQSFVPRRGQETILGTFGALELIEPSRDDYVGAASVASSVGWPGFSRALSTRSSPSSPSPEITLP